MVTRWDGAFPQYRVGHLAADADDRAGRGRAAGVAVAGAAPTAGWASRPCVGSGRAAARRVLASLDGGPRRPDAGA